MAYDFQLMWKEKQHKLLWETRYSIRQRRHRFDEQLATMTSFAMPYFGQSSHGLIRNRVPDGKVTVGDLKVLGTTPEKKSASTCARGPAGAYLDFPEICPPVAGIITVPDWRVRHQTTHA